MAQPIVKSRRQHIRLWFEFYKLCLDDPDLQENINKSADYYAQWGDVRDTKFDDWWKEKSHLFGATRVEVIKKVRNHPNNLHVSIPLNQSVTLSIQQIKEIIDTEQRNRLMDLGIDPNSKKSVAVGLGKYELTSGVEIRGRTLNEILVIYQIWTSLGKPAINIHLIKEIRAQLINRPKSKWVPFVMIDEDPIDPSNIIRQVRRLIQKGNQVAQSVSRGEFPGRSRLK